MNLGESGDSGVNPGDQSLATSGVDSAGKRGGDGDRRGGLSADSSNGKGSNGGNDGLHIIKKRREGEINGEEMGKSVSRLYTRALLSHFDPIYFFLFSV